MPPVCARLPKSLALVMSVLGMFASTASAHDLGDTSATMWAPYAEWSVDNPSIAGDPFDVIATVEFVHADGTAITTEMFYDGGTTWKFRFTATRLGDWSFTTSSADPELDGHTGTVAATPNTVPNIFGFMTQVTTPMGTQWAREKGNDTVVVEPFVPQLVMLRHYEDTVDMDADVSRFIDVHGFTGVQPVLLGGWWFDATGSDPRVSSSMTDPDIATFVILEALITKVHAAGGVTHLWAWGDDSRSWTSSSLAGGIGGAEERRLDRYIAARLGPLPGWSLGYGFDLDEWVSTGELTTWRDFMHANLGWSHYFGGRPAGPNSGTDHAVDAAWNADLDYASYEHHEPSYDVYVAAIDALAGKPVMSEDRFRIRGVDGPDKDYTEPQTRRGMWHSTMAGGVANIWGNLTRPDGTEVGSVEGSLDYPNPRWIRTYEEFFFLRQRFGHMQERDNALTDGYALRSSDDTAFIFYAEDMSAVQVDLSGAAGPLQAFAVDTTEVYAEIDLGLLMPTDQTVDLPAASDWAIAVGEFPEVMLPETPRPDAGPMPDAGGGADGGARDGRADARDGSDGGVAGGADGGCGCHVHGRASPTWLVLMMLGVVLVRRRRARRNKG